MIVEENSQNRTWSLRNFFTRTSPADASIISPESHPSWPSETGNLSGTQAVNHELSHTRTPPEPHVSRDSNIPPESVSRRNCAHKCQRQNQM